MIVCVSFVLLVLFALCWLVCLCASVARVFCLLVCLFCTCVLSFCLSCFLLLCLRVVCLLVCCLGYPRFFVVIVVYGWLCAFALLA